MEVHAKVTAASPEQVWDALVRAWDLQLGSTPARESLCILLAQWALETAEGHKMICWSVGNSKQPTDDHDYCLFPTTEYVQGFPRSIYPPDPGCRFRAFKDLDDGVCWYLQDQWNHWTLSWPSVVAGNVRGFCIGLKSKGYFTAPVNDYIVGVQTYFDKYIRMAFDLPTTKPDGYVSDTIPAAPFAIVDAANTDDDPEAGRGSD
jgi:hypothetical protein